MPEEGGRPHSGLLSHKASKVSSRAETATANSINRAVKILREREGRRWTRRFICSRTKLRICAWQKSMSFDGVRYCERYRSTDHGHFSQSCLTS